jgi:hypothetical protein
MKHKTWPYVKMRRKLEVDSVCNICGREEENSFHAIVTCTKSRALRQEMRKVWDLPPEHKFAFTGPEWLQNLLQNVNTHQRSQVLMLLWRAWHLRNDIVHGKGQETIARSVAFLRGYDSFLQDKRDKHHANPGLNSPITVSDPITNGSIIVANRNCTVTNSVWTPPKVNELKMNVDAAFCAKTGEAAAGIVARDHLGRTIAAASTVLQNCANVEEAEATTIWSGMNFRRRA